MSRVDAAVEDDTEVEQFQSLRLRRKEEIATDIWLFELEAADGGGLPTYRPGAHVTVQTPSGSRRHYSLCDAGERSDYYSVAIKGEREGRGASLSMMAEVEEGDELLVSEPDNTFALDVADEYLFIAGGIGVTPIMSMVRRLKSEGHSGFRMIYCTRDPESTAFLDELREPFYAERVTIHHDQGDPDNIFDLWPLFETPGKQLVYCCGPRPMMEEVQDMTGHWPSGSIRFEDFASDVEAIKPDDRAFRIRHADTGKVFDIPDDGTILDTLRQEGSDLRSSCESGTCGTCKVELVSGEADHRDSVLQPYERDDYIMICVSRAKTDELVLRW